MSQEPDTTKQKSVVTLSGYDKDGQAQSDLTFTLHDENGVPVPGRNFKVTNVGPRQFASIMSAVIDAIVDAHMNGEKVQVDPA